MCLVPLVSPVLQSRRNENFLAMRPPIRQVKSRASLDHVVAMEARRGGLGLLILHVIAVGSSRLLRTGRCAVIPINRVPGGGAGIVFESVSDLKRCCS